MEPAATPALHNDQLLGVLFVGVFCYLNEAEHDGLFGRFLAVAD